MAMPANQVPRFRRLTRAAYHQIGATGVFDDERVELIDGMLVEKPVIVPQYWIVNLVDHVIEGFEHPHEGRYTTTRVHPRGDVLPLVALPDVAVAVTDILPPLPA